MPKLTLPAGQHFNVTNALSVAQTVGYGIQGDLTFEGTVYLTLSASAPTSSSEYDAELLGNAESPLSFQSVQGVSGQDLYAFRPATESGEAVQLTIATA